VHESFSRIEKYKLTTAPVLSYPRPDCQFILDTDASDVGIGSCLSQIQDGEEKVVAYASKALSKCERKYSVTRKELLALVYFVKYYRHYLYGQKFLIRTDHGSLRWLYSFKEPEGQIARWIEALSMYDFEIQHRPGRNHNNADGLSRIPYSYKDLDQMVLALGVDVNSSDPGKDWIKSHDMKEVQMNDPILSKIIEWKQLGERPPWKDLSAEGQEVKSYWCLWPLLHLKEGVLCKRWEEDDAGRVSWQMIIPRSLRAEVCKMAHDHPTAGHLGEHKTFYNVKKRFFWSGYRKDVEHWCRTCEKCAARKDPTRKNVAPLALCNVGMVLERVHIDILGPLPRSNKGKRYILVIVDWFTKWTDAFPIANQEAQTCAKVLVEQFVCRFGSPKQLHSDQGAQFESSLFQSLTDLLGIEKTRSTALHPISNGIVERSNRTIESMLSKYVSQNQRDWDEHLPMLMLAYRSTVHESTGYTPNYLMFGRELNLPIDLVFGGPERDLFTPDEYVSNMKEKLEAAHEFVRDALRKSSERQKVYYDRKKFGGPYEEGQYVWLFVPYKKRSLSPKLQSFWEGPYKIVQKINQLLYRIQKTDRSKPKVVHYNRLKRYYGRDLVEDGTACETQGVGGVPVEYTSSESEEDASDHEGAASRQGDSLDDLGPDVGPGSVTALQGDIRDGGSVPVAEVSAGKSRIKKTLVKIPERCSSGGLSIPRSSRRKGSYVTRSGRQVRKPMKLSY
jgi:hypothetical protein